MPDVYLPIHKEMSVHIKTKAPHKVRTYANNAQAKNHPINYNDIYALQGSN